MSDKSNIEWTDATWNPIRGCSRVSEGCRNCYAERVAARFSEPGQAYHGLAEYKFSNALKGGDGKFHPRWTGKLQLVEKHLEDPLRWKRPRRIFVNSMSDLFHESLSNDSILRVFEIIRECGALDKGHVFQILTKRAERMYDFCARLRFDPAREGRLYLVPKDLGYPFVRHLTNCWLGVSVEDQKTADERIPWLLKTPAYIRWISAEPLLGPVHFDDPPPSSDRPSWFYRYEDVRGDPRTNQIHWVIAGGESGPGARPMHPDWARSVRDQCTAAGVPFFFKQWGEHAPLAPFENPDREACARILSADERRSIVVSLEGKIYWRDNDDPIPSNQTKGAYVMTRIGKKTAGRLLDGRTWDEYPKQ